jgi:hypothetical protein
VRQQEGGSSCYTPDFRKENLKFNIELIQETLQIKKHQVLEQLYNSRHRIIETETTDNYGTF